MASNVAVAQEAISFLIREKLEPVGEGFRRCSTGLWREGRKEGCMEEEEGWSPHVCNKACKRRGGRPPHSSDITWERSHRVSFERERHPEQEPSSSVAKTNIVFLV
ncbi:hypothetical protein MTO96_017315 [Rhipicephalus appendiculatus]